MLFHTITTGFTCGIAVTLFVGQIKDFLGLDMGAVPSEFIEKLGAYATNITTINPVTVAIGAVALVILILWPKVTDKLPGSLIAIIVTTAIVYFAKLPVNTIGSVYGELSSEFPSFHMPAFITLDDIDAIGVTYGPGLVGALLVGVAEAKAIAYAKKKPLVGVHHIEGHVSANYIEHPDLEPPFLCEIISGGHTHLVIVKDYGSFEILGRTRDDAAGEAFDKVARAIGLGYPGGPKIDKLAKEGNPHAIDFPRAHMEDAPYDFSFSGVKSAVLNHLNKCRMIGEPIVEADIAASFQQAVVDVLVDNAIRAAKDYHMDRLAIAGGVASNGALRAAMEAACEKEGIRFYRPSPIFCTDNAAMIGVAAYYEYQKGTRHGWDLNAVPNLKLGER